MTELEPTPAARRSFRPGGWFGIFGDNATVLLPPTEKRRVAALWDLVDDGAGFDEVLDALVATGLRDLPAFVLVSDSDGTTQVVLRGHARATFSTGTDEVSLDGSVAATWVERSLTGVRRTLIEVEDSVEGDDLALGGGLVRVARVDHPPYSPGEEAADDIHAGPVPAAEKSPRVEPDVGVETEDSTGFETGEGGSADVDTVSELDAEADAEVEAEAAPEEDQTDSVPPVAVPGPVPAEPSPPDADHDGRTRAGEWDSHDFSRRHPGIPGQQLAPSVVATPVARLVLSSGVTVEVDRAVLVGRAPEARRLTSSEQPRMVTVPSPNQEISSTHLEVRPGSGADHGSAVVTDLGSTNGTVLVQPGLAPEDLQPGTAVQLTPGAIIDLGDGVTIQVTKP